MPISQTLVMMVMMMMVAENQKILLDVSGIPIVEDDDGALEAFQKI
jgi:hypothetical protein